VPQGADRVLRWATARRVLALVAVAAGAACRDQPAVDGAGDRDSAVVADSVPVDTVDALTPSSYDEGLGALLLVPLPGDATGALASVLSPLLSVDLPISDTTGFAERLGDGLVSLFGRQGALGEALLAEVELPSSSACPVWPTGRVSVRTADSLGVVPRSWLLALPAGRARAVALDSIEALPARDSAMLAAALTRLASGLAEDSGSAFRGLPFRVTRAYRTRELAESFLLGEMVRRVPQEDRPLEERLFVVVSTPSSDPTGWRIAWHERGAGREEEVIASEPLAVVETGASRHVVVFLRRDDGTGTSLALLERVNGRWRVRWESPVAGC
jgi:hypothetical protein